MNNHFGKIHTLEAGDTIILTTRLGTRIYSVVSVEKVGVNDFSGTAPTTDNWVTLYNLRDESVGVPLEGHGGTEMIPLSFNSPPLSADCVRLSLSSVVWFGLQRGQKRCENGGI